ncbi:hypothetical protein ACKAV7_007402 [Fusarium commune]
MFSNAIISATTALLACSPFAAAAPQGKTSEHPSAMANSQTFPALTGSGVSLASAQIPGCSMIMLPTHPRASEIFAVMSGRVYTEAVPEGGVLDAEGKPRVIRNEISAGQATIFYQGTKHTRSTLTASPPVLSLHFPLRDGGFAGVAPGLFSIKAEAVIRLLGEAVDGEDMRRSGLLFLRMLVSR